MAEKVDQMDPDEKIVEIAIERLRVFENHPFRVEMDSQMKDLQDSIKKYGIITPVIVRPRKEGYYEIISGHRRIFAAEKLGYRKVPTIIRYMTDDQAVIAMVDSNLQRERIQPSEKAFAYKMKYDVLKRKSGRRKAGQVDHNSGKKGLEIISEETGDSPKQVQRYIKMADLIPELLEKVDEGNLVGEWVKFPTTEEELKKVFERIGIESGVPDEYGGHYEEWFITDYDCYVPGLTEAAQLGEYENLDELNYLASKLMELDDCELDRLEAAMEVADENGSVKDIINLIDNPEKYEVYAGIENDEDLGHYYIDELGAIHLTDEVRDYFDYEAYGRDMAINDGGHYTSYGYVKDSQDPFRELYDGEPENIPEEYRITEFVHDKKERTTMDYETFKQEFAEDIKERLSQRGYGEVITSFHDIEKTNQNYEAISVVQAGSNVGVNYNIENAFGSYEHSGDYEGVLASATGAIASGLDQIPVVDVNALMNYEVMKEKLSVEVISAEVNEELLSKVPHAFAFSGRSIRSSI